MKRSLKIPEDVRTHFSRQKASGKSIADYCRENNIRAWTFYGWNKRYKEKSSVTQSPSSTFPFIEMPVRSTSQSFSSGIRITRTVMEFPVETAGHLYDALNAFLSCR